MYVCICVCVYICVFNVTTLGKSVHDVFLDHYDALSKILSAFSSDLIPHFIAARILSVSDHEEIQAQANPNDKAMVLLKKVSAPLESGYYKSFHCMLNVMCIHGNHDLKALSKKIIGLLPKQAGMLSVYLIHVYLCKDKWFEAATSVCYVCMCM